MGRGRLGDPRWGDRGRAFHGPYLLDAADYEEVRRVARARRDSARAKNLRDAHGRESNEGMRDDIIGAAGELAACRALWIPWPKRVDTFKAVPDIGEHTEVRTTTLTRLNFWLTPKDPIDRNYIYMFNPSVGLYFFVGWISGQEAREIGVIYQNPRGVGRSTWIPQDRLHRLREFPFDRI